MFRTGQACVPLPFTARPAWQPQEVGRAPSEDVDSHALVKFYNSRSNLLTTRDSPFRSFQSPVHKQGGYATRNRTPADLAGRIMLGFDLLSRLGMSRPMLN